MAQGQITLFLCGDVMTGRGVDHVFRDSCPPHLHEPVMRSAAGYVELAERANGPIPRPVAPAYVWGDALDVLDRRRPDARIINLETSVTTCEDADPKGINYRMHPRNVAVLTAARIDCCVLANNHVLDWGAGGLLETLDTLGRAGIAVAGAGRDSERARAPAIIDTGRGGRVLVLALGAMDSGIPAQWAAQARRPGVHRLPDFSERRVEEVGRMIGAHKLPGDIVVASIHWGGNWGFDIPVTHRRFAHALVDRAGADVVHGHSSHHPKAIEVYRGRPILYGCGDFLDDYEGIGGNDEFRSDLVLMYLPTLDAATGALVRFEMVPFALRNFRLNRADAVGLAWLHDTLGRECGRFGHAVEQRDDRLALEWR